MTCIIRTLFGIPCPTCGVTRATIALLKGNISDYFYYNAFALPIEIAVVLFFIGMYKKNKVLKIISLIILGLNIPYYLYRLFNNLIP